MFARSPGSKRLAPSRMIRRLLDCISSNSARAPADESTTLARSGSMPRSTPCSSATGTNTSSVPSNLVQASGLVLSG